MSQELQLRALVWGQTNWKLWLINIRILEALWGITMLNVVEEDVIKRSVAGVEYFVKIIQRQELEKGRTTVNVACNTGNYLIYQKCL